MVKRKRNNIKIFKHRIILYIIGLTVGIVLVSVPLLLDICSQFNADDTISNMTNSYSNAESSAVQNMKKQADLYNQNLAGVYNNDV